MARPIPTLALLLAVSASFLAVPAASAQPSRGLLGPSSRAEVRISVSVAPRFQVNSELPASGSIRDAADVLSNTTGLRYAVRTEPLAHRIPNSAGLQRASSDDALLVIVVPD